LVHVAKQLFLIVDGVCLLVFALLILVAVHRDVGDLERVYHATMILG
jgi:hypothetical protein